MAFRIGALVGVNPLPLSLRELCWMYDSHEEAAWEKLSYLLATLLEPHRDRERHPKPFSPAEFNLLERMKLPKAEPVKPNLIERLISKFGARPAGE